VTGLRHLPALACMVLPAAQMGLKVSPFFAVDVRLPRACTRAAGHDRHEPLGDRRSQPERPTVDIVEAMK